MDKWRVVHPSLFNEGTATENLSFILCDSSLLSYCALILSLKTPHSVSSTLTRVITQHWQVFVASEHIPSVRPPVYQGFNGRYITVTNGTAAAVHRVWRSQQTTGGDVVSKWRITQCLGVFVITICVLRSESFTVLPCLLHIHFVSIPCLMSYLHTHTHIS